MLHKEKTEMESRAAQHQKECEGDNRHVSKVERRLEQTIHTTSLEVVEERVSVDENTSHTSIDEGTPPPSVIFSGQLEVQQCHTNEGSHDKKKDERKEEDSEESIHLVTPHCSKDVVEFNVDSREGQESSDDHLCETTAVPWHFRRNFTSHFGCAGGGIEVVAGIILSQNTSKHSQWKSDTSVDESDG